MRSDVEVRRIIATLSSPRAFLVRVESLLERSAAGAAHPLGVAALAEKPHAALAHVARLHSGRHAIHAVAMAAGHAIPLEVTRGEPRHRLEDVERPLGRDDAIALRGAHQRASRGCLGMGTWSMFTETRWSIPSRRDGSTCPDSETSTRPPSTSASFTAPSMAAVICALAKSCSCVVGIVATYASRALRI